MAVSTSIFQGVYTTLAQKATLLRLHLPLFYKAFTPCIAAFFCSSNCIYLYFTRHLHLTSVNHLIDTRLKVVVEWKNPST